MVFSFRQNTNHQSQDEKHNNFNGMVWALFNKGKIFEKMAQHPVILNTSNIIIGENSAVSSLAANTVLPGNGGIKEQLNRIKSDLSLQANCPTWTTPTTGCSCPPPTLTSWTTLLHSPSSLSPSSPTSTLRTVALRSGPTLTTSPATRTTRRTSTRTLSRSQARPAT